MTEATLREYSIYISNTEQSLKNILNFDFVLVAPGEYIVALSADEVDIASKQSKFPSIYSVHTDESVLLSTHLTKELKGDVLRPYDKSCASDPLTQTKVCVPAVLYHDLETVPEDCLYYCRKRDQPHTFYAFPYAILAAWLLYEVSLQNSNTPYNKDVVGPNNELINGWIIYSNPYDIQNPIIKKISRITLQKLILYNTKNIDIVYNSPVHQSDSLATKPSQGTTYYAVTDAVTNNSAVDISTTVTGVTVDSSFNTDLISSGYNFLTLIGTITSWPHAGTLKVGVETISYSAITGQVLTVVSCTQNNGTIAENTQCISVQDGFSATNVAGVTIVGGVTDVVGVTVDSSFNTDLISSGYNFLTLIGTITSWPDAGTLSVGVETIETIIYSAINGQVLTVFSCTQNNSTIAENTLCISVQDSFFSDTNIAEVTIAGGVTTTLDNVHTSHESDFSTKVRGTGNKLKINPSSGPITTWPRAGTLKVDNETLIYSAIDNHELTVVWCTQNESTIPLSTRCISVQDGDIYISHSTVVGVTVDDVFHTDLNSGNNLTLIGTITSWPDAGTLIVGVETIIYSAINGQVLTVVSCTPNNGTIDAGTLCISVQGDVTDVVEVTVYFPFNTDLINSGYNLLTLNGTITSWPDAGTLIVGVETISYSAINEQVLTVVSCTQNNGTIDAGILCISVQGGVTDVAGVTVVSSFNTVSDTTLTLSGPITTWPGIWPRAGTLKVGIETIKYSAITGQVLTVFSCTQNASTIDADTKCTSMQGGFSSTIAAGVVTIQDDVILGFNPPIPLTFIGPITTWPDAGTLSVGVETMIYSAINGQVLTVVSCTQNNDTITNGTSVTLLQSGGYATDSGADLTLSGPITTWPREGTLKVGVETIKYSAINEQVLTVVSCTPNNGTIGYDTPCTSLQSGGYTTDSDADLILSEPITTWPTTGTLKVGGETIKYSAINGKKLTGVSCTTNAHTIDYGTPWTSLYGGGYKTETFKISTNNYNLTNNTLKGEDLIAAIDNIPGATLYYDIIQEMFGNISGAVTGTGVTSDSSSSVWPHSFFNATVTLTLAPTKTITRGDIVTADGITADITVTAVASQTSVTVSAFVTIPDNVTVTFYTGTPNHHIQFFYFGTTIEAFLPCLSKNTMIKTTLGAIPIESLKNDDYILDQNNNPLKIKDILKTTKLSSNFNMLRKNSLAPNVPNKNLIISDYHIVKHNGKIYLPKNSNKFRRLPEQEIEFYHIETDDYTNDWFWANNCQVETFTDGKNQWHLRERLKRFNQQIKNTNKLLKYK